ncbi:hypothetical protein, partial [Nocardiopsis protaetiae]|uniref:hypothetical protein n=1 Tax=Nocardiopsis protaetiae TaxID=3382270 RepID=UPI00387AB79C
GAGALVVVGSVVGKPPGIEGDGHVVSGAVSRGRPSPSGVFDVLVSGRTMTPGDRDGVGFTRDSRFG